MWQKLTWWLALVWLLAVLFLSRAGGQPPAPPRPLPPSILQAGFSNPGDVPAELDLSKLTPLQREMFRSARSGTEWLCRVHQPSGRFVPGWLPDLNRPAEGDHFLRQAGATFALARSARVFRDERYATRARQAVLTLLAETGPDPADPHSRCTTLPSAVVNRLGAAGVLLAAIHELPEPASDLLDQGEQLARFIARRQSTNGSFQLGDTAEEAVDADGVNHHPGAGLYGLMRSNIRRPAAWKLDVARRAVGYYAGRWAERKELEFATGQIPAFAEAFVQSTERARDARFADYVFDMADWLCSRQLRHLDPRHPHWQGGFTESGRAAEAAPTAAGTACAAALVEASRVTRQKPDAERYSRYSEAAAAGLQFAITLQYTESNTQHFAAGYRQRVLLGGFHASPDDGSLRLDDSRHAVAALAAYWEQTAQPAIAGKPR